MNEWMSSSSPLPFVGSIHCRHFRTISLESRQQQLGIRQQAMHDGPTPYLPLISPVLLSDPNPHKPRSPTSISSSVN